MSRLLFVDNYDSFTYNVVHLLAAQGAQPDVLLNDDPRLGAIDLGAYAAVAIGPGPGTPSDAPEMLALLRRAMDRGMPVLGVCLGLQAIGELLGAKVVHAPVQMHGKVSHIEHDGSGIFAAVPSPFEATRYHSLCLDPASIPTCLRVTARSADGVVQAIADRTRPIHAVQFHPESVLSQHGDALIRNFLALT